MDPPSLMHVWRSQRPPLLQPRTEWRRIALADFDVDDPQAEVAMDQLLDRETWRQYDVWDGFLHPEIGALGKWGGGLAWGTLRWGIDFIPRWVQMLVAMALVRRLLLVSNHPRTYDRIRSR